jgi:hypothetical protein
MAKGGAVDGTIPPEPLGESPPLPMSLRWGVHYDALLEQDEEDTHGLTRSTAQLFGSLKPTGGEYAARNKRMSRQRLKNNNFRRA